MIITSGRGPRLINVSDSTTLSYSSITMAGASRQTQSDFVGELMSGGQISDGHLHSLLFRHNSTKNTMIPADFFTGCKAS